MKRIAFSLLLVIFTYSFAQHVPSSERGDPNLRRKTAIDANKLRASVFNFGITGREGLAADTYPYEWPKNSGKLYIAEIMLWVGAQVVDESGKEAEIVCVASGRTSPTGKSWNFEPVPGYLNKDSKLIAKSDEPSSWPSLWPDKLNDKTDPGWPGTWNGYFGKDQFNADQEIFYKISDDLYNRFNYYPDTTDYSRGGLGLLTNVRVMEWSQVLVEDAVFILYEIKNDGTKDLDKVSVCLMIADLVGGDGDSHDDQPDFDLVYDIAWSKDADGLGNSAFGTDPVGVAATAFLETPGNSSDRIDNDGDGETNSPVISFEMIEGELHNRKDDNGNGLVDEDSTHVPFGKQKGVGYADHIDNNANGEASSPVVTQQMIDAASADKWKRWPPSPGNDPIQMGQINLIGVSSEDKDHAYKDFIDNDKDGEANSPTITQEMIQTASLDSPYFRFKIPNSGIILYDVKSEDLGLAYADGKDNDGDGAIDEGIDENIDELIDESRDDFIDNDEDWNALTDDLGLDGKEATNDQGEKDGKPTSGAGTDFPGEPQIDKTDISESDQMGITGVDYGGGWGTNYGAYSDRGMWQLWYTPGRYWQPPPGGVTGDYNLYVNSGYFPLKAGQTERISTAVCMGENTQDAIRNKEIAQKTYDQDYQFAKQPIPPNVKAFAGDGRVTLYWDDISERSFDRYMSAIGQPGYDFEGYRIYRATDTQFQDVYQITDAQGILTFYKPMAQFDLIDGIVGYHPVDINGVKFYLGSDTGIQHSFIDSTVQNGQTYYYAVVAYDFGGNVLTGIPPTECTKRLTVDQVTGNIIKGPNVVVVTPEAPAAGYIAANIKDIERVKGLTSSVIQYKIIDPQAMLDKHTYTITFADTIRPKKGGLTTPGYDTLSTNYFYLIDRTVAANPETLINKSRKLHVYDEQPVMRGFQLILDNRDVIDFNKAESHWSRTGLWKFFASPFVRGFTMGQPFPADYRIEIGDKETGTSTEYRGTPSNVYFPSSKTNFTVKKRVNITGIDEQDWVKIPFGFGDYAPKNKPDGILNADSTEADWIVFLDDVSKTGKPAPTWRVSLIFPSKNEAPSLVQPQAGDTAFIVINKPFLSSDVFEFTTNASRIDTARAREELRRIKVVPNPYLAAATWEPRNPYTSGRGPRSIHFNHLPAKCTIRIFTISGELVDVIEHDALYNDGSEEWNLLTSDNLSASYGIYLYYVNAPGIGEHIGKFAIIK